MIVYLQNALKSKEYRQSLSIMLTEGQNGEFKSPGNNYIESLRCQSSHYFGLNSAQR